MADFRPISVFPTVIRMIHKILAQRLDIVKHHEFQTCFLKDKPISRNIFLLRVILKKAVDGRSPQYVAFLDFRKAFDSVNHDALCYHERGGFAH